ncbi:hypothetical protein [uncultured Chryseobacterium sp.]|uniref:hypothetical protein n=1 Tax=uncultured Chryseobacterium sp. TaxID=259322 RepID=UPI002614D406|nr:hypothetical protein [uncultured Chryseobacterium sp.]
MKKVLSVFILLFLAKVQAQVFSGQIFMRDNSIIYLNQVYVTNMNEHKTVISDYNGEFKINAKAGDVIRFTSIITERKDITLTSESLSNSTNFIELKEGYIEIPEIVIKFKPTGNLKTDVLALKKEEKSLAIAKIIGLPAPKGDGNPPQIPVASLAGGGLSFSIESIYDIISGDRKKKQRLYEYEKMNKGIATMKNYFGEEYFANIKIPKNLIDNFLQFVYTSDNINPYLEVNNIEGTKPYIEKYLPIYQRRLRNSHIIEVLN